MTEKVERVCGRCRKPITEDVWVEALIESVTRVDDHLASKVLVSSSFHWGCYHTTVDEFYERKP